MKRNHWLTVALTATLAYATFTTPFTETAAKSKTTTKQTVKFDPRPTKADLAKGFYTFDGRQALKYYHGIPLWTANNGGVKESRIMLYGNVDKGGNFFFYQGVTSNGRTANYMKPDFVTITKEELVGLMSYYHKTLPLGYRYSIGAGALQKKAPITKAFLMGIYGPDGQSVSEYPDLWVADTKVFEDSIGVKRFSALVFKRYYKGNQFHPKMPKISDYFYQPLLAVYNNPKIAKDVSTFMATYLDEKLYKRSQKDIIAEENLVEANVQYYKELITPEGHKLLVAWYLSAYDSVSLTLIVR